MQQVTASEPMEPPSPPLAPPPAAAIATTGSGTAANGAVLHPAAHRPSSLTTPSPSLSGSGSKNGAGNAVSITVNPIENADIEAAAVDAITSVAGAGGAESSAGTATPAGTESPGTSQMSPPPSYHDIPGTVPAHQGVSRGPPPSYEDAVDPNAEPPSYDSLFGRIRDTHKSSRNLIDFLAKLILLLLGTIGCTVACSITVVIPVCMIIIGSLHVNDCPIEPNIPLFLIVGGSFSVLKYILNLGSVGKNRRQRQRTQDGQPPPPPPTHPGQYLINCFLCAWFITGCVWVYRVYPPVLEDTQVGDPNYSRYCHVLVYNFAFWLITSAYIFLGLFTSCICCFSIIVVMLKGDN